MNSNSTVAQSATRRENTGLGNMIKALVWEECRVGGVIAGWCVVVGVLCLVFLWWQIGDLLWHHNREFVLMFVGIAPLFTALLLIVSTDYSGHLVGGFSERILHLPVPASAAVGVALAARTVFVFLTAWLISGACEVLFGNGPGVGAALAITLFYLLTQTFDWLRKPLSGLASGVSVVIVLAAISHVDKMDRMISIIRHLPSLTSEMALFLCLLAIPVYGVSVAAVHATRVGRRIGIPEIWEWHSYVSIPWFARSKRFATPLAAQVWFDLRRSWWVLPGVTVLLSLLFGLLELFGTRAGHDAGDGFWSDVSIGSLAGVVIGALAHNVQTGILDRNAKPQPQFLHPLTSAQFACARITANAFILVPLLFVVLLLHWALTGSRVLTDIMPDALAIGATSYQEVLWVLLSRGILVGLLAWPLMNGTRTVAFTLSTVLMLGLFFGLLDYRNIADWQDTRILLPLVAIASAIGAHAHARRTGVISLRALLIAVGVWALATWILFHAVLAATPAMGTQTLWHITSFITCLGWAALIPLPYVSAALDVRRRRHAGGPPQDPAQHVTANATLFKGSTRTAARVAIACVVLFFLWLAWPSKPAYEDFLRAKGYPATPEEVDKWYPAVPEAENRALAYLDIADRQANAQKAFFEQQSQAPAEADDNNGRAGIEGASNSQAVAAENVIDRLLITGNAKSKRGEPIATDVWETTEAYWQSVTSTIAPELKQLAADTAMRSRYPVDLRRAFAADLPQLATVRQLARELAVGSLHWTLAKESGQTVESIGAMIPLANSLSEEPLIISQLVRVAVLGIAYGNAEDAMNRSVFTDADLAKLDRVFASALPPFQERMIMDRAIIGEVAMGLHMVAALDLINGSELHEISALQSSGSGVLFWQLAAPAAGERMVMMRYYNQLRDRSAVSDRDYEAVAVAADDDLIRNLGFFSPLAAIMAPAYGRTYEAEWRIRTQFDIARTAFAVERYRLAKSRLPETLDELVPIYLPEIPMDYYDRGKTVGRRLQGPLRYRQLAEDSFVVYSVGADGEDDQGVEMEKWWQEGDITFTVAPLSVRTGPQVADVEAPAAEAEGRSRRR
ncbi:MAG: hypothetical protein IT365_25285 [Candidatus Hydrogenedentes bacterium]|nr:hypothetical protein [Candidatus Hydrogenedentota bacterium]